MFGQAVFSSPGAKAKATSFWASEQLFRNLWVTASMFIAVLYCYIVIWKLVIMLEMTEFYCISVIKKYAT